MVFAAADLLVANTQRNIGEIQQLIVHHSVFPPDYKIRLWKVIGSWIDSSPDDERKAAVREAIRRHALSRQGKRTKTASVMALARKAFDRLLPADLTARHRWLFENNWIEFSADEREGELNHEAHQRRIDTARAAALREVWRTNGLRGVIDFACAMKYPQLIGLMLARKPPENFFASEAIMGALSHAQEEQANAFIRGLLSGLSVADLASLLDRSIAALRDRKQDEGRTLRICCNAPAQRTTWDALVKAPPEIIEQYWKTVPIGWGKWSNYELEFLIKSLLEAKRPRTAFHAAYLDWKNLSSENIIRILEEISSVDEPNVALPESYYFDKAFERLDEIADIDRGRIAQLEFRVAPALVHGKRGHAALNEELCKHPKLFVQMISYMYPRNDDGADPEEWKIINSDAAKNTAHLCHGVLDHWHRLPGILADGTIDAAVLMEWVTQCRKLCKEYGRQAVGEIIIGEHLAYAPTDTDGAWPCLPVREILEEQDTEDICQGLHTGVINKRGITTRALSEGGQQERALAETYDGYAKAVEAKWPRTAAMLARIADDYRRQAECHDKDARLNERSDL
jgi:hypothetical protein